MIGKTLFHYRIVSELGRGGMGAVYLAEDTELGREVALKVLPPEMAHDRGRLQRFNTEARSIAALNHPNIVTVFSVEDSGDGQPNDLMTITPDFPIGITGRQSARRSPSPVRQCHRGGATCRSCSLP